MPNHKPNLHEIPKFYLKGFSASGSSFLWVFERDKPFNPGLKHSKNNPAWRGIKTIGLRSDSYATRGPDGKSDYSYESRLQREEQKANKALSKVRNQEEITIADKEVIAGYIQLMIKRLTRRDDRVTTQILDPLINSFHWDGLQRELAFRGQFGKALQVPKARELLQSKEGKSLLLHESMVTTYEMTHEAMLRMPWNLLVASEGEYFITSDNPIIYDEHSGLLKSPLIFPISQRVILLGEWSQGEDLSYKAMSAEETRKFNTVIVRYAIKEIYSPEPDEWIHDLLKYGAVWQ
jgi:hypothetical protein